MFRSLDNWMKSSSMQEILPVIGTSIPLIILPIAILSIPLAAAKNLGLTAEQTASWILGVYGLASVLSIVFSWYYQQPLLVTGNVFILIFVASLADETPYAELVGACMLAGLIVVFLTATGLTARLSAIIPPAVVLGLLAGAVMTFVSGIFTSINGSPTSIGGAFLTYLIARRLWGNRIPPVLPAMIVGLLLAALGSELGSGAEGIVLPAPEITSPVFSLSTILAITPVFVILILLQANVPSIIFLRNQGYAPPERVLNLTSGIGTTIGALLGPLGISLSLPATSIAAAAEAGELETRHRAVYVAATAGILIGLLAGIAAFLTQIVPAPLLLSLAGLTLVDVLANAILNITRGPLILGPLFAFAIALSDIELLGLGPYFWAIVIGTGVALLLEQNTKAKRSLTNGKSTNN